MVLSLGTLVFAIALAMAIAFAWMRGRKSAFHRELAARPILTADAMRSEVADRNVLDPQTTRAVLGALGEALAVDSGRLRLTDRFDDLWDMDSRAGFHQRATFETWIFKRYPGFSAETVAPTIVDLVTALQKLPLGR